MLAALFIAHMLNRSLKARTFFRMGVLLPNVTSIVAVTIIFAQLFGRDLAYCDARHGRRHVRT